MIDMEELKVGRTKGITNLGYMELDYLQEIILLAVSRQLPGLVFKGGTALYKLNGLDRFSTDLDFTGEARDADISRINEYISNFGYGSRIKVKHFKESLLVKFLIRGPHYNGNDRSLASIQMDVNGKETPIRDPELRKFFPLYSDLPSFPVKTMDLGELAAEKVRALLTRNKARDAYDLVFLIEEKGVELDVDLINGKLDYYSIELSDTLVAKALKEHERDWEADLGSMTTFLPEYEHVREMIEMHLLGK
jgi:predicted nucleotidyltransferase component of viral defense system